MEKCIADMKGWMASNRLKLNPEKTEVLWTGSSKRLMQLNPSDLVLNLDSQGSCNVTPTNSARLLGVSITPDLSLRQHALHASSHCFWQLCEIRSVRRSLESPIELTIVAACWPDHLKLLLTGFNGF